VRFDGTGRPEEAVMSQPAPTFGAELEAGEVARCFSLAPADLRPDASPQVVSTGVPFLIVPAASLDALKRVEMDRPRLRGLLKEAGAAGAFMFSLQGFSPEVDTHARLLDPDGTMEDPFTGSASGCMGAFVVHHGLRPGPFLRLEQGHLVGRPGYGLLEIIGTKAAISGIKLSGPAVKTTEGTILIESEDT
jgi:trans-2,3-dihydro-3-hydroxyanthranilate isomerase